VQDHRLKFKVLNQVLVLKEHIYKKAFGI